MEKPVLISGIQPTGELHIGNYLGALKNFIELQNSGKYRCYFFIADLHSLSEDFDPNEKSAQILETAAEYLAGGLDSKKSTIFLQSKIPVHTELAWILNNITPMGEMERMTQFKDKSASQKQNVNLGLFTYPVLMAADILLYDAKFVPVGEDQLQHLELARTLARKFNNRFGKTFVEPQPLMTSTPRVMSLKNPGKKMSKSDPGGCLFVDESPESIRKKISGAVTDSGSEIKYDQKKKAGISNLLEIYSALSEETIRVLEKKFAGRNYSYFKARLAELISDYFADFRKKKKALLAKPSALVNILETGSENAAKIANKKISEVKRKIGLSISES
jgi:tryptophanyl-tRNA synthetase